MFPITRGSERNVTFGTFSITVTLTTTYLERHRNVATGWLERTRRIFSEERLAYEIDDNGIVHPAVDKGVSEKSAGHRGGTSDASLCKQLGSLREDIGRTRLAAAERPGGLACGVRSVEGLFKLMFASAPQLNAGAVDALLASVVQKLYQGDTTAQRSASKQLAAFKEWVDASHNYRHEAGSEEPVQPPVDLAVLAISNGTGWLTAIDQDTLRKHRRASYRRRDPPRRSAQQMCSLCPDFRLQERCSDPSSCGVNRRILKSLSGNLRDFRGPKGTRSGKRRAKARLI